MNIFTKGITNSAIVTCVLFQASCSNNDELSELDLLKTTDSLSISKISHEISKSQALKSLNDFLDSEKGTRFVSAVKISNVFVVYCHEKATRIAKPNENEKLLYVANFENNNGFAVMAADDRIGSDVLAISENGSLSAKNFSTSFVDDDDDKRVVVDGFSLEGDGFFSVAEYPGEVFMNPNTVTLYDENAGDTLVGNFSIYNVDEVDENGNHVITQEDADASNLPMQNMMPSMLARYAYLQKKGIKPRVDLIDEDESYKEEQSVSEWRDIKTSPSILSAYKGWHQNSPYNSHSHNRRKWCIFGHQAKAPVGCFPLAIAKVMTYFRFPSNYANWDDFNIKQSAELPKMLRRIGDDCKSQYFYNGTFTFPIFARKFMRKVGFKNVESWNYSFERVLNMLNNGCPVIVYGMHNYNLRSSHSWNIDGYKLKERIVTIKRYNHGRLFDTYSYKETQKMVHCDFGWGEKFNGYYISGVFDTASKSVEFDGERGKKNKKYNNHLRILMFDNPNK